MDQASDFFSKKHLRLLNIAGWARTFAWIVLVVHILWTVATFAQQQAYFQYYDIVINPENPDFFDMLIRTPWFGFSVLIEMLGVFLRGIMYFLVLKGISLGLNMIVETDINYREQAGETHER